MTSGTGPLTRGYAIELFEEGDGTWTALVPDLPGCVAAGDSPAEAVDEVGEAIDAWIASAREDGSAVPLPTRGDDQYSGRFVARVPKSLHRALAARASREGVSLNTLCVAGLTQVVTQGLAEAEFTRISIARGRQGPAMGQGFNAVEYWPDQPLKVGPNRPFVRFYSTEVDARQTFDTEPWIPAGMIDSMRGKSSVRG